MAKTRRSARSSSLTDWPTRSRQSRNGRGMPPKETKVDRETKRALDERKIAFMAARLREASAAANEAAVRGELKVTKGLRFGERVGGGAGAAVPVRTVVFARDCYIELSFDSRQLKAVRHYIRLNPARCLWKLRRAFRRSDPLGDFGRPTWTTWWTDSANWVDRLSRLGRPSLPTTRRPFNACQGSDQYHGGRRGRAEVAP